MSDRPYRHPDYPPVGDPRFQPPCHEPDANPSVREPPDPYSDEDDARDDDSEME